MITKIIKGDSQFAIATLLGSAIINPLLGKNSLIAQAATDIPVLGDAIGWDENSRLMNLVKQKAGSDIYTLTTTITDSGRYQLIKKVLIRINVLTLKVMTR